MSKQFCTICHVFPQCEQMKVGLCLNCVENSNENDLIGTIKSICQRIKAKSKIDFNIEMYDKYEEIAKSIEKICSDDQFKVIKSFLNKPFVTLDAVISHLILIFTINERFYFTSSQAKELVKKTWPSDNYKWHNLLVFMCLDLNELANVDFTCGICYFGNMGDQFKSPAHLTNYLIKRGFDINQKHGTFY